MQAADQVDLNDTSFADQCEWDKKGKLQKLIRQARDLDVDGHADYFLTSLQVQLNSKGFLTPKQIEALETFEPRLDEDRDNDRDGFEPSDLYD